MTALGRIGRPPDIADLVALLARSEGRWITGQNLRADGGLIWSRRDGSADRRDHLVEDTAPHVADEVGELLDAHLDALSEVVGDDDPAFGGSGVVDVELRTPTAALSAERGDVTQGGVLHGGSLLRLVGRVQ
jgi:hypothetical protein